MTKIRLILSVMLGCSLFATHAAAQKVSTNAPVAKLPNGLPFYGKLGAFDKTAQTITLDGKEKKRIFHLTPSTRIHRDKKPASLNDLMVGQWVGGFARPDADGRPTVVTLNLGVVQRTSPSTNAVNARPPRGK